MQAAASKGKVRRRVLVVDDNIDNVRSLTLLFDSMGHHSDYAINAIVAVDVATRFKPDVVILDLLLPDGHGAQVCRQIRLNPELRGTRIYCITGSRNETDRQRALEAGCDEVLLKPVPPEKLERLVTGD
jgi:two-component system alkaline phosphatase synthesis response regulator PhoP